VAEVAQQDGAAGHLHEPEDLRGHHPAVHVAEPEHDAPDDGQRQFPGRGQPPGQTQDHRHQEGGRGGEGHPLYGRGRAHEVELDHVEQRGGEDDAGDTHQAPGPRLLLAVVPEPGWDPPLEN
jgi:hypothetical protein